MDEKSPDFLKAVGTEPVPAAEKTDLFSTPIYAYQLSPEIAAPLNAQLLFAIEQEHQEDRAGLVRSNLKPLGGWHSRTDLQQDPDYHALVLHIASCTALIEADNNYDPDYPLTPTALWAIVNPPGSANRAHVHPSALWSGAYYAKAPDQAGDIEFTDPRTANIMLRPRYSPTSDGARNGRTTHRVTPKAGKLLIFPSWLYHSVAPNLSTAQGAAADRVVFSFNLSQRARPAQERG